MSKVQVNTLQSLEQPEKVVDVRDLSDMKTTVQEHSAKIETDGDLIFESLRRSYAEAGYNLVAGSFEDGGTLTNTNDVLLLINTRIAYSYSGALPKVVAPSTDPTQSADWVVVAEESLRGQIAAVGSQVLIGGVKASAIAAGGVSFRNKIVDGRFDFWYEKTSQTTNGYGSDTMWRNENIGGTKTHSRQSLNTGADLPAIHVPSAKYFSRTEVSSVAGASNYVAKITKIENVRTLAGKKATLSFYAKADADKDLGVHIQQSFGTGGTPSAIVVVQSTKLAITNQWVRYSLTFDVPSIYGKTLGTKNDDALDIIFGFDQGSSFSPRMGGLGHQSGVFDLACVQLEEGEQATKFEELPIAVVENLVGRYYETNYPYDTPVGTPNATGGYRGFTHPKATGVTYGAATQFRVPKRAIPEVFIYNNVTGEKYRVYAGGSLVEVFTVNGVGKNGFVSLGVTTLTAYIDVSFYYVADARI